jgi:hypothetical protein
VKKSTKIAIAFIGIAALGATAAQAEWRPDPRHDMRGGMMMEQFKNADADNNGDVTLQEFESAISGRLGSVDANGDKKLTVAEVAAEIQRMRDERMAKRIIDRLDTNGDGELTLDEVQNRGQKLFALMDRNDDGKIDANELPRGHGGYRHHGDFGHHGPRHGWGGFSGDNDN